MQLTSWRSDDRWRGGEALVGWRLGRWAYHQLTAAKNAGNRMNAPPPVTLINVFTVDPARQDELVALLAQATEASVHQAPGFISATLHRSLDGTKVAMYAQWQSRDAYQTMRADPTSRPYLERALTIATFEPGMYEVVRTFLPARPLASPSDGN